MQTSPACPCGRRPIAAVSPSFGCGPANGRPNGSACVVCPEPSANTLTKLVGGRILDARRASACCGLSACGWRCSSRSSRSRASVSRRATRARTPTRATSRTHGRPSPPTVTVPGRRATAPTCAARNSRPTPSLPTRAAPGSSRSVRPAPPVADRASSPAVERAARARPSARSRATRRSVSRPRAARRASVCLRAAAMPVGPVRQEMRVPLHLWEAGLRHLLSDEQHGRDQVLDQERPRQVHRPEEHQRADRHEYHPAEIR